jgi:hypothetical protein
MTFALSIVALGWICTSNTLAIRSEHDVGGHGEVRAAGAKGGSKRQSLIGQCHCYYGRLPVDQSDLPAGLAQHNRDPRSLYTRRSQQRELSPAYESMSLLRSNSPNDDDFVTFPSVHDGVSETRRPASGVGIVEFALPIRFSEHRDTDGQARLKRAYASGREGVITNAPRPPTVRGGPRTGSNSTASASRGSSSTVRRC